MCGITGFFSYKNKINTQKYYNAHIKIAHRGPDDEGFIYKNKENNIEHLIGNDTINELNKREMIYKQDDSPLVLGHRRLSIIDLTSHGHQPFVYENLNMVYNGEIYNYIELRDELLREGYDFETDTDTEVFLKAYHCWGVESFNKFNGMWASAIYDKNKDEILLTRDRFGIKPLYYSLIDDNLIFGSELKFNVSFINKLYVNEQVVHDYIEFGYLSHTNETFFKDIFQLGAGNYLIYNTKGLTESTYYETKKNVLNDSIRIVKDRLFKAIKIRLRADVEVGSLLSGGMDSSSIVCSIYKEKYKKTMDTFTLTYKEKELDYEAKYVEDINRLTEFQNHSIYLEPNSDIIDKLTYIIETPYRSFTESAMYEIYSNIKENSDIKVLLNGEGSDEIFSGYNEHYAYFLLSLLQVGKLIKFYKELNFISKRTNKRKIVLLKEVLKIFLLDINILKKQTSVFFNNNKYIKPKKMFSNSLKNKLYENRKYSALPEYLKYADKISMNFSLEVRLPFLDYRLVEVANSLEEDEFIKNGITKYSLREAMKDIVPKSVYERKDKKGFFTPHDIWFKTEFSKNVILEMEEIKEKSIFSFMNSDKIYKHYKENGMDNKIWRIYCLSRWKKTWNICDQ